MRAALLPDLLSYPVTRSGDLDVTWLPPAPLMAGGPAQRCELYRVSSHKVGTSRSSPRYIATIKRTVTEERPT